MGIEVCNEVAWCPSIAEPSWKSGFITVTAEGLASLFCYAEKKG